MKMFKDLGDGDRFHISLSWMVKMAKYFGTICVNSGILRMMSIKGMMERDY